MVTARNYVHVFGKGSRPMLFAHGFGCDQNMWRFLTPAFEANFKIVLFDYVGAGKSDLDYYDPIRYSSLSGYASDVLEICEELHLREVVFVGHSVSSIVGLLASIERPELFSNLILVGPSPCYINDGSNYVGGFEKADIEGLLAMMDKNYMGWANYLAPAVMANADHPELSIELEQSFCSTDPVIARQFAEVTFLSDSRNDLPRVTTPSLILQCSDDIIAPDEVGVYLSEKLANSVFMQMEATGHCPHMSHPEETIRLLKTYLDSMLTKGKSDV
jgi:sigma-B regulation protein RsbQ